MNWRNLHKSYRGIMSFDFIDAIRQRQIDDEVQEFLFPDRQEWEEPVLSELDMKELPF